MKYINSVNGNHRFAHNGTIIMGWTVCGNETVCVSLDHFEGDWLRFKGNFNSSLESLQQLLIDKQTEIDDWIPKAIEYAAAKKAERDKEVEVKRLKEEKKEKKDRAIPLYRYVTITKGKHKISILTQPYEVGIYIVISDSKLSSPVQLCGQNHKKTNKIIDGIISKFPTYKSKSRKDTIEYPLHK